MKKREPDPSLAVPVVPPTPLHLHSERGLNKHGRLEEERRESTRSRRGVGEESTAPRSAM
ncbi:hypothetical protein EYF80_057690 [Liparis tanakae]|uniref:Uncharacterized protein n=1 Tax=Liparis tanakae TaxID=230148 RepID=A0A4Z2ETH6_9TELE|nr:hypothetical protein EYF80_057690 [Liparis tanakae]